MDNLQFPFTVNELTEEEKKLCKDYGEQDLVRLLPSTFLTSRRALKYVLQIYNFKPRPDDIWLIGYPRSGTTLTQEILYLLGNDLDYEKAASKIMDERFPYLEQILIKSEDQLAEYEDLCKKNREPLTPEEDACVPWHIKLDKTKDRRFIKSHLGFAHLNPQLLEVGCKVVFIARNVKDCIVSTYFYPWFSEDKKENGIYASWKLQQKNIGTVGDNIELLKEAWKRRHNKNLLIFFYEDINKDKRSAIKKISNFLGKKLTEEELETLIDHVDIKKFRENKSLNNDHLVDAGIYLKNEKYSFIRKGKIGGWREYFSKEMNDEVNEWFLKQIQDIPDFQIPECWKEAMDL